MVLNQHQICKNATEFGKAKSVTFLNPYSFLEIYKSDLDLGKFDKICIDGIALKLFLNIVYRCNAIQRQSFDFTSVANLVFKEAAVKNQRGFILGSDKDSNKTFLSKIRAMFPGASLEGRSGYFESAEEKAKFLSVLGNSDYDFIVIGMGAVKQEEAAITLIDSDFQGKIYTCGGFIHQTALGGGRYYPEWINKLNLRFVYRMYKEPSTIQRYFIDYPKAFVLLLRNIRNFK